MMNLWHFFKAPKCVDEAFYLREYPDVRASGMTGSAHYVAYGRSEGRHPNIVAKILSPSSWPALLVYPDYYNRIYPDVARSPLSAREHYIRWGRQQGRHPNIWAEEFAHLKATVAAKRPDALFRAARRGRYRLTKMLANWLNRAATRRGASLVCGIFGMDRLPEAGGKYALNLIEPPKPFVFYEPREYKQTDSRRERRLYTPALWVAEVRHALILGAFQVISDGKLVVYEPAADPRYAFAAGASRHIAAVANNRDQVVVHFPYKEEKKFDAAILLSGRCSPNYFHWLIEYLSKMYLLSQDQRLTGLPVIVDADMFPSEFDSLSLFLGDRPIIMRSQSDLLRIDSLFIPSQPTFHPDDVSIPFWEGAALCYPTLEYLRSTILSKINTKPPLYSDKVYLVRRTGRNIVNGAEVERAITRHGFTAIDPSSLSFSQQVNLFQNAKVLVGAMGAAFSNLIFCQAGTRILALSSPFTRKFCMQANLASFAKCEYTIIVGTHPAYGDAEETQRPTLGLYLDSFSIDVDFLSEGLQWITEGA
ncbi:glycosyltransferase family 61 protein [Methylobacterium sp. A49B]